MMKNILVKSKSSGLALVVLVVSACSEPVSENVENETVPTEATEVSSEDAKLNLENEILNSEKELSRATGNRAAAIRKKLIDFYVSYADIYKEDPKAAEMTFKAGNEAVNVEDFESALQFYLQVEKRYPKFQKRPEAIYLQGFIYDTYTHELGKAESKYQMLIELYPNHVLSEQAKVSIANLGMTDEELIRKFESQNN